MGYITSNDVYRAAGISSSVIPITDIDSQIQEAENIICYETKNIYWKHELDAQLASSGDTTLGVSTITKTAAGWTVNAYADMFIWVYSGTGSGQIRKIVSNTATIITVDRVWATVPDNTSYFRVFYVPPNFNPYYSPDNNPGDVPLDGNDLGYYYLPKYPVQKIESLSIQSTAVTVSTGIYLWNKTGRIQLKSGAEYGRFTSNPPQGINISYWYGVDGLPYEIKRLCELHCSIQVLGQQMGGTYNAPGSVSLPEMTVSVGQQYINIRSTLETLKEEYNELIKTVIQVYPVFG
jgi:hypothetical protein